MGWLLNLVYATALIISLPWQAYRALVQGKSRRGWAQKLLGRHAFQLPRKPDRSPVQTGASPTDRIWLHAVSVGEINLLQTLIDRIKIRDPQTEIVISTSTETGFDLAQKKYSEHIVFFCPWDFTWAVRNTIRAVQPTKIILAELELWPNLIRIANQHAIPIGIVNGRLSKNSFTGYRRFSWLLKRSFRALSFVYAQTETYANRFVAIGCQKNAVHVTGNVKFDGLKTDRQSDEANELAQLAGLTDGNPTREPFVWIAGSTQFEEDLAAVNAYCQLVKDHPQVRLILVPRHPNRIPQLTSQLKAAGVECRLRSKGFVNSVESPAGSPIVWIVDVIGELSHWWALADVGYVGGSMGKRGGQNMLEPAGFGVPICFGPRTENFRSEVNMLLQADAAMVVHDQQDMKQFVQHCVTDPAWAKARGERAKNLVLAQRGAADQTVTLLFGEHEQTLLEKVAQPKVA